MTDLAEFLVGFAEAALRGYSFFSSTTFADRLTDVDFFSAAAFGAITKIFLAFGVFLVTILPSFYFFYLLTVSVGAFSSAVRPFVISVVTLFLPIA